MKKRGFFIGIIIAIVLIIIPLIFYVLNFHDQYFSSESSDWGTFGDYVGGVVNPVIGLLNVIVLIYLTLKIADIDDKNRIDEKKNRVNENLDNLRLTGFKELNAFYIQLVKILSKSEPIARSTCLTLKFEFDGIIHPYINLFETFNDVDRINEMSKKLLSLEECNDEKSRIRIIHDLGNYLSELKSEINSIFREGHS